MTSPAQGGLSSGLAAGNRLPTGARGAALTLKSVPPLLRPALRAYLIGYASVVGPRLLTLVLQQLSKRSKKKCQSCDQDKDKSSSILDSALHIIRTGFEFQRFPTFCAVLVGGSTFLRVWSFCLVSREPGLREGFPRSLDFQGLANMRTWYASQGPLLAVISQWAKGLSRATLLRLSRWLSTFVSAWLGYRLLQANRRSALAKPAEGTVKFGGRTLDLTLFTATRALDVLVGELWAQHTVRRKGAQKWTKVSGSSVVFSRKAGLTQSDGCSTQLEKLASNFVDPAVFAVSCAFIMWSWFYHPERLPRSYNKWITSAAMVDLRLIEALRRCKEGKLLYGKETGQAPLLGSMCADNNWPLEWGDPSKVIPFPCEMVHMGCGSSCEYHAVSRFVRSWKWAMYTYLPLALALKFRNPTRKNLVLAFFSASRSSVFLGTFITLFYYGVCLGRTRVGPHLLGKDIPCRQRIDSGLCVGTGCFLCGWSVLIETAGRQKDMALFVAPRALATVVPRKYPVDKQWRETLVFSASAAVIMTCVLENPKRVRGVLGKLLNIVVAT